MVHQKQVATQVDTLLGLIEQMEQTSSEANEDMESNAVSFMRAMNQLEQLLAIPSAGCEI